MRVARLFGVGDLRVVDEPDPDPAPGHSLVRVTAVGICGSDLHWFTEGSIGDAALTGPLVLGHEAAGVVEQGPLAGRRVAIDPSIPCEQCDTCRRGHQNLCPAVRFCGHSRTDGAMRELMSWPDDLLFRLPDEISDIGGAVLEPLGVALHALDLGRVRPGVSLAVVGCGPIGLLALQLARAAGVGRMLAIEPLEHRRTAAAGYGADVALSPDELRTAGRGEIVDVAAAMGVPDGFDVVLEAASGDDSVELAVNLARPGARVVLGGIPGDDRTWFPASVARRKGLSLLLARRMNRVYPRVIELARRGVVDVDGIVTGRYALADAPEAMRAASAREGLKTVVMPN